MAKRRKRLFKIRIKEKNSLLTLGIGLLILMGLLLVFLEWPQVLFVVAIISGFIILYEFSNKFTRTRRKSSETKSLSKGTRVKKIKSKSAKTGKGKSRSRKRKTKKRSFFRKTIRVLMYMILVICILGVLGVAAFVMYIVKNAPHFDPEELYSMEATDVYASNGELIAKLGREKRQNVTYDELPETLVDAIIATEDSRFFQHNGFDLLRFSKATYGQVTGNTKAGGASTLTMQISKNKITNTDQTIIRKFTDIYMSIWIIEKNYTKKEILEFYVNSPYLGGSAYGVEQASQNYFGKSVTDINLAEAAMIAGLFQLPGAYDPYLNPEAAETRRKTVLSLMKRHGYINEEEYNIAKLITVEDLVIGRSQDKLKFQGYIDTVIEEVLEKTDMNPYDIPMKIYTNMDMARQTHVDKVLAGNGGFEFRDDKVQVGFCVTDVNNGKIVAIGTGRSREGERLLNFSTGIKRQPGSTAKPLFDYGPAFEYNNWSTYHPILDAPYTYSNGVKISNWDNKHLGLMTLREAFRQSRNIPALKTFQSVDNEKIIEFVTGLGITPELTIYGGIHEAHAIGGFDGTNPYEMSGAYAAFANGGYYTKPYTVSKIIYKTTGEVVEYNPKKERAMKSSTAYMVNLSITMSTYSNGKNIVMAAKTGTTNLDSKTEKAKGLPSNTVQDAWVIGYTPNYSMAMWYGYEKTTKEYHLNTTKAWADRKALFIALSTGITKVDGSKFPTSKNVVTATVEKETFPAAKPSAYTPSNMKITEYFIRGTTPTETSPRYSTLNNVDSLDISTLSGNRVSITWDYSLPTHLTDGYLNNYYENLYGNSKNAYLASRRSYDSSFLGSMIFEVYRKNGDSSLTLLGFTSDKSFEYQLTSNNQITFIVKTTYTKFKSNISIGNEITLNPFDVEIITMDLNGADTVTLEVGDTFTDTSPPVIVMNNLVDVTSEATTTSSIKRNSDDVIVDDITTLSADTYTITYETIYKSQTEISTRTVIIEEVE